MDFIFNGYSFVLLIFGSATIFVSLYIFKKGGEAVRWLSLMMFANAFWSIGYGLELASSTLAQITLFINIQYLGITTLPVFWYLFALNFSGKDCWYKKRQNVALILVIPILTIFVVWTNNFHHLHYKNIVIDRSGDFPMANLSPGIWYFVYVIYFYSLLVAGCYLILRKFQASDAVYRSQNYIIVISAFIPWIANISYLLGFKPLGHIDATPFAFIVTTIFILIAIYRFKLFDIIPIAREKVLELMQDGFLMLNQQNKIMDYNKSILRYIKVGKGEKIIGADLEKLLPNQPAFFDLLNQHIGGKAELILTHDSEQTFLEVDILFLNDNKINTNFSVIKIQDQTGLRKYAMKAKEQARELEKLNALKDRIFSIISHDLRGPLVNLSEILKMIANDQITNEEFKSLAPTLSKDIIYTTDLLENILHWSRSQLKGFGIKKEFFNLRNLIINEINYHLPAATIKKVNIVHDVFPGEMVYADVLMIQIVMRNILNNAIKFCKENCEIIISAGYQKDQMMVVCIQDNGIGIPPETLGKLFKKENITTRGTSNEKGTGLGLMVCKDFMKRNDGDIKVTSEVGKGSKFYISLPTAM